MKLSEWALKIKDGISSGLGKIGKAADKTAQRFTALQDRANQFTDKLKRSLKDAADEVPGLGRALSLIRNPIVLATAGVVALGATFMKAGQSAAAYQHQFLELKQLNLDKPVAELNRLDRAVKNVSIREGLDAGATAKAFFDIQSATGKYGAEVEKVVEKIGQFSHITKADFDASINGAAKAMINFRFGAEQLDDFLASSFKTVQVGITTFDQLAQVQTEFAGAAAAAGQDFNTANKVFAAFTQTAKNVDIAATLTKTAFEGLIDKNVISGLEKYGVTMFDARGQFLQTDKVIAQLVPKLKSMNDQQFSDFMGSVGGPEGLRKLMVQIKTGGDDLLKTFENFNNTEFDLGTALANAKGDFTTLKDIVGNQLNTVMIQLGETILPMAAKALNTFSQGLSWIYNNAGLVKDVLTALGIAVGVVAAAYIALNAATIVTTISTWALNIAMLANPIGLVVAAIGLLIGGIVLAWKRSETFRGVIMGLWEGVKAAFMGIWNVVKMVFYLWLTPYRLIWNATEGLRNKIAELWGKFKEFVVGLWPKLKAGFNTLVGIFKNLWDKTEGIRNKIAELWGKFKEFLHYVGQKLLNLGGRVLRFFGIDTGSIKSMISEAGKAGEQIGDKYQEGYKKGAGQVSAKLDQEGSDKKGFITPGSMGEGQGTIATTPQVTGGGQAAAPTGSGGTTTEKTHILNMRIDNVGIQHMNVNGGTSSVASDIERVVTEAVTRAINGALQVSGL